MKNKRTNNTISWIINSTKTEWKLVIVLMLLQISVSSIGLKVAVMYKNIVDEAIDSNIKSFVRIATIMVMMVVLQVFLNACVRHLREYTKASVENRMKNNQFKQLLNKDYASVTSIHTGEWMNRLTTDTRTIAEGVAQIIPDVVGLAVKLFGGLVLLFGMVPEYAWIMIPGGLAVGLITYVFRKTLKTLQKNTREKDGLVRIFMQENLSSLMIVHSFNKEDQAIKTAWKKMGDHKAARMKRMLFSNICQIGFGTLMNGLYVTSAIYCGYQIILGNMSYGTLTAVLQLVSQIRTPFQNITGYLPRYYAMLASAERLMNIEEFKDDIEGEQYTDDKIQAFYENEFIGFELSNVSFTYQPPLINNDKTVMPIVLNNINAFFSKGDYIALTGPSGCGKSTILKLLMCLYPLDSGNRIIHGKNMDYPLSSKWRGFFAYVPQGNQLMSGTIRDIVTFNSEYNYENDEKIWKALKVSCAEEFVSKLKSGLDTQLGEGGSGLSEGQMQRLAIARALYSDHPVLLLDESTSALDGKTEVEVLNNIRNMTDKTMIIVTHRPAALQICDYCVDFTEKGIIVKAIEKERQE